MFVKYFRWYDFNDLVLSHNLCLTKGLDTARSLANHPAVVNSFYGFAAARNKKREDVFEKVRLRGFSSLPSRRSAIWIFDDYELAQKCGAKWNFVKQGRDLVEVNIAFCRVMVKLDSKWVSCDELEYESNAQRYWSGELSASPEMEILFDGQLQLLGDVWRKKCKLLDTGSIAQKTG